MDAQRDAPGGQPGAESKCAGLSGFGFDSTIARLNATRLKSAAAEALRRELWIIAQAGDQVHRNHPLTSDDLTRLHEATCYVLTVLRCFRDD